MRCPTRRPRPRPTHWQPASERARADVHGRRLLRAKPRTCITRVFTASGTCSLPADGILGAVKGAAASLTSKLAHPRPQCRAHATRFGQSLAWIGSDAASCSAARQHAAGCGMCRPQRDCAQVALGCNRVHVVATHSDALLCHTCLAQRQMPQRAAEVAHWQMSAGDGFGCGADVVAPPADAGPVPAVARAGPAAETPWGNAEPEPTVTPLA